VYLKNANQKLIAELFMEKQITNLTQNAEEVVTLSELKEIVTQKKKPKFYYGTAPTGPFHIGYLVPLVKIIDLIKAGFDGTLLIADYHAYLDDRKTPWEELEIRSEYYTKCAELFLGEFAERIRFVRGSEFQNTKSYIEDTFKLAGLVDVKRAVRAASEVVRGLENPKVSSLLYPIIQVLMLSILNLK
jgi:tyrosyl-tRNA synthetase